MVETIEAACRSRISLLRKSLPDFEIDGIIFTDMNNIRYLSGFTGSDGVLIMSGDEVSLLVDGRYTTQANEESKMAAVYQYQNKMDGIQQAVAKTAIRKIGFEAACVSFEMFQDLSRKLNEQVLVPLGDQLKFIRTRKDQMEIETMKKAAEIGSEAIASLAGELRSGCTEAEAALQLEIIARRLGADQIAFDTIVASGPHAALPHAKPTNRKFQRGDFVVIDFGVRYKGYCSDETCTFAFGELTEDQKNAYRAVKQAHDEAIAVIEAGMAASDVDALVRRVLGEKYSAYFVHGTGHGVGLEVHEAPRLAPNSSDRLDAETVVTVEPGLYYPGMWGIRIEDTVVVKNKGCETLTKMNKELIIIE